MNNGLPDGFTLRNATWEDLEGVRNLIYAACVEFGDAEMAVSKDDLATEWKTAGFDLSRDCWVVTDPSGKIVGTEEFINRHEHCVLGGDGYVYPGYYNLGIGSAMLAALVARAQQELPLAKEGMRVYIRNGVGSNETNATDIHQAAGFSLVRYHWRMEINLGTIPDHSAPIPEGLELRPFDVDSQDHQLYLAHHDAFKDHWGHTTRPYEYWVNNVRGFKSFDPTMWLVAWDGNEIAGYALNREKHGIGWVGTLGVRRAWRKRGLGLALLQSSFNLFRQRGLSNAGLSVDAANPTGATRLYKKAGMTMANEYVIFEKQLRDGIEPADT